MIIRPVEQIRCLFQTRRSTKTLNCKSPHTAKNTGFFADLRIVQMITFDQKIRALGAPGHLHEHQIAGLLNLSVRTVQRWRQEGGGPDFYKFGRAVRYDVQVVKSWIESRARTSTSASSPARPCCILHPTLSRGLIGGEK